MPASREQFSYALLRVVPHVERGEAINAGVVLFCRRAGFLAARVQLDDGRLHALAPDVDPVPIRRQLESLAAVAAGEPDGGPVAALDPSERFGWLAAPSSTVIQPSPTHTGLCDDPQATLDRLFETLVRTPALDRLAHIRRSYETTGLDESMLAPSWLGQFERWLTDAFEAGVFEANAMVFATADPDGCRPSGRTVLLKGVGPEGFVLYTNLSSRKGREALANPNVSLVFAWVQLHRQVTVTGRVEELPGAESDAYFAARPRGSQLSALVSPQSRAIASRDVLERGTADLAARFPAGAPIPRPEHWGGLRVVPDCVEFWQGRPDRLHDRLRFRHDPAAGWVVERLAP